MIISQIAVQYVFCFFVFQGLLYSQDRILQAMGNIALAFHLLCERADPNSFWMPYIKTLPSEYDTPLYFEEEEVHYLQSAQAINDVYSQYKNTARQYAYFYKVIQVSSFNRVDIFILWVLKIAFQFIIVTAIIKADKLHLH